MVIGDLSWFGLALFLGLTAIGITKERDELLGFAGLVALVIGVQSLISESMLIGGIMVMIGLVMLFAILRDRI